MTVVTIKKIMTSENERTQFPLMDQDLTGHFSESVIGTARGMECWMYLLILALIIF